MAFRLTKPEPLEQDIQNAILRVLKIHPIVSKAWRQNTGAMAVGEGKSRRFIRFGIPGQPDIQGYLRGGRALYIEVKRPSGKLTDDQKKFLQEATAAGALAFVARSVDEVFKVLDSELRG